VGAVTALGSIDVGFLGAMKNVLTPEQATFVIEKGFVLGTGIAALAGLVGAFNIGQAKISEWRERWRITRVIRESHT